MWSVIYTCRKALVEHSMLRRPEERTTGFLTTTLRRYINRSKMDRMAAANKEKDFEKLFKRNYWSYSKSMLRQPLMVCVDTSTPHQGEDSDEVSLKLFHSIQLHAGQYTIYSITSSQHPATFTLHHHSFTVNITHY